MYRRILVPLDGSDLSETALKTAVSLCRAYTAKLYLLHAVHVNRFRVPDPSGESFLWPELSLSALIENGQDYLSTVVASLAREGIEIFPILDEGEASAAILKEIEEHNIDLIVMTTHGYTGVDRFLLGSVTEKVVRHAPCPVLVVR